MNVRYTPLLIQPQRRTALDRKFKQFVGWHGAISGKAPSAIAEQLVLLSNNKAINGT
jgi:hypothetical protein